VKAQRGEALFSRLAQCIEHTDRQAIDMARLDLVIALSIVLMPMAGP
jgi:hypothetical protein